MARRKPAPVNLAVLLPSWELALRSERKSAATVKVYGDGVRAFLRWCAENGHSPALDRELMKACAGKEFRDRRDEAIVRLMTETGMRAGEVCGLTVADVDLTRGLATVRRGKGGKGRVSPFGPQTGVAIDRYLRMRRGHLLDESPELWLGDRGKRFNYDGLHKSLKYRADRAKLTGFHPHLLRHTAATRWLRAGGS